MYLGELNAFEPINPMDFAPTRVTPNYATYVPLDLSTQQQAPDYGVTTAQPQTQFFPAFNTTTFTKPIVFGLGARELILIGVILYFATRRKK